MQRDRSRSPLRRSIDRGHPILQPRQTGWRPVADWESLCHDGTNKEFHEDLRDFLSECVCHLAKNDPPREMLYKLSVSGDESNYEIKMHLAIVRKGDPNIGSNFVYAKPVGVTDHVHRYLKDRAVPEAGIVLTIDPLAQSVHVDFLGRNLNLQSEVVDIESPRSKPPRIIFCAAAAMAAELLLSLDEDIRKTEVNLWANDTGDGKLFRYYENEYGLKRTNSHDPNIMTTTLFDLVNRCRIHMWIKRCREEHAKQQEIHGHCDAKSFLSLLIEKLQGLRARVASYRPPAWPTFASSRHPPAPDHVRAGLTALGHAR